MGIDNLRCDCVRGILKLTGTEINFYYQIQNSRVVFVRTREHLFWIMSPKIRSILVQYGTVTYIIRYVLCLISCYGFNKALSSKLLIIFL